MTLKLGSPKPNNINKLLVFTGPRNSGKTMLAATYEDPEDLGKVAYFDLEKSANNFREGLARDGHPDFGYYADLEDAERRFGYPRADDLLSRIAKGQTPWMDDKEAGAMLDYYLYVLKELNGIPYGKYRTLVFDTFEKVEAGMRAWCDKNATKLRIAKDHGKMEVGLVRPLYENFLNSVWSRGIETIILNFHLRGVWANNRPVPNKVQMSGNVVLYKRSSLMVWLVPEPSNPNGEPAGLVIKERMANIGTRVDEVSGKKKWNIKRTIPPRIPCCTWEEIRRYQREGYNVTDPKPEERPSREETQMISELFNDEQMRLMMKSMEVEEKQAVAAMIAAGVMPTFIPEGDAKPFEKVEGGGAAIVPTDIPQTKSEALSKWKELGRTVPKLLGILKEKEIGDSEIGTRWNEIVEAGNPTP